MITTDTSDATRHGPVPAPLVTTTSMTLFGSLIWIGPLLAVVFIANAIVLAAVARWGELDESIWRSIGGGWIRWPVGATGFTMSIVFLPMFVTNGVTRSRLVQSATLTMVTIAVLVATVVTAGYAIEGRVFDAEGWRHVTSAEGGRLIADIGYPTILASLALVNATYFASGWFAATALRRFGALWFVPCLLLALAAALSTDVLLMDTVAGRPFDGLLDEAPSLWVGVPATIAIAASTSAAASRLSRSVDVD